MPAPTSRISFGYALDIDDSVALVASLDLDRNVGAERALLRTLLDQAMNAGEEAAGGQCVERSDGMEIAIPGRNATA